MPGRRALLVRRVSIVDGDEPTETNRRDSVLSDAEERLARIESAQKAAAVAAGMQGCGCLLTLFVTLPIVVLLLVLLFLS